MNAYKTYSKKDIEFYGQSNLINALWWDIQSNHDKGLVIYFENGTALEVVYNNYQINNDGVITESRTFSDKDNLFFFVDNIIEMNTISEIQVCPAA
jgi:hypothetical protein